MPAVAPGTRNRVAAFTGIAFLAFVILAPAIVSLLKPWHIIPAAQRAGDTPLDHGNSLQTVQFALLTVGVSLGSLAATLAVYHRSVIRRTLHFISFCILLELFYRFAYGGPVSAGVLLSVEETSNRESWELIAGHPLLSACLGTVALLGLYAFIVSWKAQRRFSTTVSRRLGLVAMVAAALSMTIVGLDLRSVGDVRRLALDELSGVFPLDLLYAGGVVALSKWQGHQHAAARAAFEFPDARLVNAPGRNAERELYVVVIGETSRRRNWSLFGYGRNTTPRLSAMRSDLYLFDHATSNATNTIQSLPLALSRAQTTDMSPFYSEKSIVGLLRQAGFETIWISNQEKSPTSANSITQIALEANNASFPNDARSVARGDPWDTNLIVRLDELLRNMPANAKLVAFLHMEGSHFSYKQRYPAFADQFHDKDRAPRPLTERKARLVDQYDNTVYFTDYILTQIIERLRDCQCQSGLLYFSDHGERLFDEGAGDEDFGHGYSTIARAEIEVPLLIFLSDAYRLHNARSTDTLMEHEHSPAELHSVFETIVDLTRVTYTGRSTDLSLFSEDFRAIAALSVLDVNERVLPLAVDGDRLRQASN